MDGMSSLSTRPPRALTEAQWRSRAYGHAERVRLALSGHLDRARHGVRHPVEDFLFNYYRTRPGQLRRWSPGHGVVLHGDARDLDHLPLAPAPGPGRTGWVVDPEAIRPRLDGLRWIAELLARTGDRPPHLACFGLHEWAMVHRTSEVRHAQLDLRLPDDEVAGVVERRGVHCTHVDAYRFFTPTARPLNAHTPTRATQLDDDQPGCLHVTMDLYKWASKASPLTPSELIMDCFDLATDVRWVDMRASPYDLRPLPDPAGEIRTTAPIAIETASGRAEYTALQRQFSDRAAPLRRRILDTIRAVLDALGERDQNPD